MITSRPIDIEPTHSTVTEVRTAPRIASVDLLRGIVIILMALDHARDFFSSFPYAPEDLAHASAGLFLTRWLSHFCAPTFVFLAGAGAFLYGRKAGVSRESVRRFLITRGVFLVALELTLISFLWRFHFTGIKIQVIWVLGWSMVFLALLLDLNIKAIAATGAVLIVGHNLLDRWHFDDFASYGAGWSWLWSIIHEHHTAIVWPGYEIEVWYPLVPWVGVMALGYAFGPILQRGVAPRRRFMYLAGFAMISAFLILRMTNAYGEPEIWSVSPRGPFFTVLALLNVTKYPPSLCYLLMTLGVLMLVLPLLEHWRGPLARYVETLGRVPLFFYVIHLPLLHVSAAVITRVADRTLMYGGATTWLFPSMHEPSLLRAYVATALVVIFLYPVCRWYAAYKIQHQGEQWLSYL